MLLDNRFAILIQGILVGAAIKISYIGSQSYLLSITEPIYAIYTGIAAGIVFSIFLKEFHLPKIKFATVSVVSTAIYLVLFLLLTLGWLPALIKALLWFFLAIFGVGFFQWLTAEIAIKHLDPAQTQTYFSYLITSYEIGTLGALISFKVFQVELSPNQIIYVAGALYLVLAVFITLQFSPKKNFEIKFTKKIVKPPSVKKGLFKQVIFAFIFLSLFLGAFKVSEDYFIKVVLKEELGSYDAIRNMMTNYILIGSFLVVFISMATGSLIQKKRISPTFLIASQVITLMAFGIACLVPRTF